MVWRTDTLLCAERYSIVIRELRILARILQDTDRNVRGIFPHIWRRAQVQSHIWRKYSPEFSLNMTKISFLGENFPKIFPYMTKTLESGENSPRFSLNMMNISICQEDISSILHPYIKRTFRWGDFSQLLHSHFYLEERSPPFSV